MPNNALCHYASKYYDPVKAHEYYEEHKQLKGRTSTAGLNEKGREAAQYVRKQINAERDSVIEGQKAQRDSTIEQYSAQMQSKIDRLREELASMRDGDRQDNTLRIKREIAKLREENAAKRDQINAEFAAGRDATKERYTNVYANELDKLKADPTYASKKKGSKGGNIRSLGLTRDETRRLAKETSDTIDRRKNK